MARDTGGVPRLHAFFMLLAAAVFGRQVVGEVCRVHRRGVAVLRLLRLRLSPSFEP